MDEMRFEYVSYIASTPEKVWQAIVDPQTAIRYWQNVNVSDWKPGSRWEHWSAVVDGRLLMVGKVIESSPPRRLVMTWAFPQDEGVEAKQTLVSFDIERTGEVVKVSLGHSRLEPGSEMELGITEGWPKVLSSMKTLLETGQALPKLW